jgi:hypothetical protein
LNNACKGKDGNDNDLVPTSERLRDEKRITPATFVSSARNVGRRNCPAVIQTFIDDLIAAQEEADEEDVLPLKSLLWLLLPGHPRSRPFMVVCLVWLVAVEKEILRIDGYAHLFM